MEYKEPTEDMREFVERSKAFWDHIDVDAMQPVIHGPPPTEAQLKWRQEQMDKIRALQKAYEEYKKATEINDSASQS